MLKNSLSDTSLEISVTGFGGMSLQTEDKTAIALLHEALDSGINFFDTADIYGDGDNERLFGKAFHDRRDQIILATKVGNVRRKDGTGLEWNPRKEHILKSAEDSLKRLNTSYIDLYQLHGGTIDDPIDETIEAFEQLVREGKIRYYGISSIRPNVIREYVARSNIKSVMMQYSLLDRRPEEEMLHFLHSKNIGVLGRGALAQGLLAGKPAKAYLSHSSDAVKNAIDTIESFKKRDPAFTAIQYVLSDPAVISAVTGIRTKKHLLDAVGAAESAPLSANDLEILRLAVPPITYELHR